METMLLKSKSGKMLYEMDGVSEELARQAFRLAEAKLPLKCVFVTRAIGG